MQAIEWDASGRGGLALVSVPKPDAPGPDNVIVKVAYSGVCGTDVHVVAKEFAAAEKLVLGHEFCGIVAAVGTGVAEGSLAVGDRVTINPNSACGSCRFCTRGEVHYCITGGLRSTIGLFRSGGWAEYCEVPAAQALRVPEGLPAKLAALCEPYSCVIRGYNRFGPIPDDAQILVIGAGIIGLLWSSLLHYHGYRDVTVSEIAEGRRLLAENLGFSYKVCSPSDLDARFATTNAEEEGFDIVVDCTGVPQALAHAYNFLRRGGKLNVFGCCPKVSQMTINPAEIMLKELTIFGTLINPFTFPAATTLVHNMADKYLTFERIGIKEYKLNEYQQALDALKRGEISKAMFNIGGDW